MTRFYKKGTLGMVKAEAGMSDPDVSEVRMPIKEYRELLDSVQTAEKSALSAQAGARDRIARITEKAREEIKDYRRQAEADANKKISAVQADARKVMEQLVETQTAVKNEKNLNENLIRIMRERANQSRSIRPKKKHDGYLVLESRQWKEKYKVDLWDTEEHMMHYGGNCGLARKKGYLRTEQRVADVWKSILQTPYDSRIPLEQIQYKVEEELFSKEIMRSIGCTGMYEGYEDGAFDRNENILYRWVFKANYRSMMWEIEIYTTNELTVPEYRLPPQLQKKKKTEEKSRKLKQSEPTPKNTSPRENAGEEGKLFESLEVVDEDDPGWDEDFFEHFDSM